VQCLCKIPIKGRKKYGKNANRERRWFIIIYILVKKKFEFVSKCTKTGHTSLNLVRTVSPGVKSTQISSVDFLYFMFPCFVNSHIIMFS
jgi:hypothetical protein